jgi:ornithine carbamoyltransferase
VNLQGRNLLKRTDLTAAEFGYLVDLGGRLRMEKRMGLRSSQASIVFDQAVNRLHTIKAVMVATAGDLP